MKIATHTQFLRLLALSLGLGLPCLFNSGCLVAAAGAGASAVAYVRGELSSQVEKPQAKVFKASQAALDELKFVKISAREDALNAEILARNSEDKKIEIKLEKVSDNNTRIRIRVGVFGDERISQAVLEKIKAEL
jgi:DnaJ-class molecular chaperone